MDNEQILTEEEKFWGPKYGSIYPYLEDATPYKRLIAQVGDFITVLPGEDWLDLGTGSGAIVELIWRESGGEVGKITALDLTEVMLNHLKKKVKNFSPAPRGDQIELVQHNLSNKLPFKDESYNGVVSNLVLPYIETHENRSGEDALRAVLTEAARVLKSGGQFVWSSPKEGVQFFKVFMAAWRELIDPRKYYNLFYGPAILRYALKIQKRGKLGTYHFLSEEKIRTLMLEAGFENIETAYSFAGQALVIKGIKK